MVDAFAQGGVEWDPGPRRVSHTRYPPGLFVLSVSAPLLFSALSYFGVVLFVMLFGKANSL